MFFSIVFTAKLEEFEYVMKKQNVVQQDTFIKLRGLPYSCSYGEIEKFFEGKPSIPNSTHPQPIFPCKDTQKIKKNIVPGYSIQ